MKKLLSGNRDQADRKFGMSLGGLAYVASQGVSEETSTTWTRSGLMPNDMSHLEFFGFQDVIKIKNKTTIFS